MWIESKVSNAYTGLLLGAALWVALSTGCSRPDPEDEVAGSGTELGNVIGILVNPDRQPAAGVEVVLYPLEEGPGVQALRTTTRGDGTFAFDVEGGAYRLLTLDGAGNGATVDSLLPTLLDTINLQEISLAPLGGIRGFVKSQPGGSQLRLLGTQFDTAFASDTGFTWQGIPAGTYWLQVDQNFGMMGPSSLHIAVKIAAGVLTELADTLDLTSTSLNLRPTDLPYMLFNSVRPINDQPVDSIFWVLNGQRVDNQESIERPGIFTLTKAMLDSTRPNTLQCLVQSGGSLFVGRTWKITVAPSMVQKWAYQAVRAVIVAMQPDVRPKARRPGPQIVEPQLGTFKVLESRRLAPEELAYWEWPAALGGEAEVSDSVQANIYNGMHILFMRRCSNVERPPLPNLPGDTVTFFLLPDSNLGAVAFRLRVDERFEDMKHLGNFARTDWPLGEAFDLHHKQNRLRIFLRPEGLQIEWLSNLMFTGSEERCQAMYQRFVVDSTGRVRESVPVPSGIDSSRILLLYRMEFGDGIDADSLPESGAYVYVDSTGSGVAGLGDSTRTFTLDASALEELKTLLSDFPAPVPTEWHQTYFSSIWHDGTKETLRYLLSNYSSALHILGTAGAPSDKVELFSQVEIWLRGQGLL